MSSPDAAKRETERDGGPRTTALRNRYDPGSAFGPHEGVVG
jgi:hypothetical protein